MPREWKRACCVCGVAKTKWRRVRFNVVGKRLKDCIRVSATVKNELLVATRLAAIDDATVIRANDVVCRMCEAHGWSLTQSMADQLWSSHATQDARRIQLLLKHVDEHFQGQLPKCRVKIQVPGWAEPGEEAAAFEARKWIHNFLEQRARTDPKMPTRLEAVKELGPEQAEWVTELQTRVEAVAPLTRMTTPCDRCGAEETRQWHPGPRAATRICESCYCKKRYAEEKRSAPVSKRAP